MELLELVTEAGYSVLWCGGQSFDPSKLTDCPH
jgi:hypothetical protein